MTYSLSWLADVLQAAGCKVVETPNWKTAGRGDMGPLKGVLLHHTAGPLTGNAPSLNLVKNGRPDLKGPLSHLLLARDGTYYVLAAGRCNHAGAGNWQGVTTGNTNFIGIEAENAGTGKDPWPQVQYDAYAKGIAAILKKAGVSAIMAAGHKEYALPKGRKIDPCFDMNLFRKSVSDIMNRGADKATPPHDEIPDLAMLKKGDKGESVKTLQQLLKINDDGDFGDNTDKALRAFQKAHGLVDDGKAGPKTWKALFATKTEDED